MNNLTQSSASSQDTSNSHVDEYVLSDAHQRMLGTESGITADVITARQYCTVTAKSHLRSLGFSASQTRVPALLIPLWNPLGALANYHIRPDSPRIVDGKPRKYEFPKGSRMALDVPQASRRLLGDPTTPLWIRNQKEYNC